MSEKLSSEQGLESESEKSREALEKQIIEDIEKIKKDMRLKKESFDYYNTVIIYLEDALKILRTQGVDQCLLYLGQRYDVMAAYLSRMHQQESGTTTDYLRDYSLRHAEALASLTEKLDLDDRVM